MAVLAPAPATLGRASPALGPWFTNDSGSSPNITLALPNADLSVSVTLNSDDQWHAPAACLRSYFIAAPLDATTSHRPATIAALRQADGNAAFDDNDLVVLLTLLPEVELRLQTLSTNIPGANATNGTPTLPGPAAVPTRPRIRYLAMSIPSSSAGSVAQLESLRSGDPLPSSGSDADNAAYIGLSLDSSGALKNGTRPTQELAVPVDARSVVLTNGTGGALNASLWAFDYRGRPVDPGAVASWWSHLASGNVTSVATFNNLWADTDTTGTNQRTASVSAGNVVHLVSVNEGPLDEPSSSALLTRVTTSNDLTPVQDNSGVPSKVLFTTPTAPAAGTTSNVAFSAAPADPATTDDAPLPRAALLPHATYGASVQFSAWGSSWPSTLSRDFVRVAITDIEQLLTGLTRADQNQARITTRITAARNTTAAPFLTTTDPCSAQVMATLNPGTNPRVVSPTMDRYWGGLAPTATSTATLPNTLDFTTRSLVGEGTTTVVTLPNSSSSQKVVMHFTGLPANVWVRCWPHALDSDSGRRFRQDGGGAQSDVNGEAFVVMAIPDGTASDLTDPNATPVVLSADALIVAGSNQRYYTELRYERPPTLGGDRVALDAVPATSAPWLTEVGSPMVLGQNQYASGMTLLVVPNNRNGEYVLVDLSTLESADVFVGTLRGSASAVGVNPTLAITTPAYVVNNPGDIVPTDVDNPGGDPNLSNATIIHHERNLLENLADFGRPVPTMERREVAAVNAGANSAGLAAAGFVGSTPGRALNHEIPPSQLGHPGMPANAEIHGTGVSITGPAIVPLTSVVNERMATSLRDFTNLAAQPLPVIPDNGGTTAYMSVLDTLTFGVTGDVMIRSLIGTSFFDDFLPGSSWQTIKGQIESALGSAIDLDPSLDDDDFEDEALAAAFDRMIVKTRDGAHQFATAVQSAITRAEDLVYIETSAIDPLGAGDDEVDLIGSIIARWAERPALSVILCVPEKFLPDQPDKLEHTRAEGVAAAWKALKDAAPYDNVELFTPTAGSGRPWHMASTTVVVDDAVAFTGSTHLWRRGLTFDASIGAGLFDENLIDGRPAIVRTARLTLFSQAMNLPLTPGLPLALPDPADMLEATRQLILAGGLQRIATDVYPAKALDETNASDRELWNPDGLPGGTSDWYLALAGLIANVPDGSNNAVR